MPLSLLSLSLLFISVFFSPGTTVRERERETETDKIIISGEILKGEQERERGYTAAEHEYERGNTLPSLLVLLCH